MTLARGAGFAATGVILLLTFGTLGAVAWRADGAAALGPADWASIRFTVLQSVLSAALSVALAVPAARALARRRFVGRGLLITLLGAPFILPVIVAVFGLIAVFGRAGLVNHGLALAGLEPVSIYGLPGVVLAHVFFNLPLATRLILQGWGLIPPQRFALAAQLGMPPTGVFRHLEMPMLKEVLPGVLVTVFLMCLTSFAVVLALGGGPRATTVELAIYQAFRFDFDLARAGLLALIQFGLCAVAALAAFAVGRPTAFGVGSSQYSGQWLGGGVGLQLVDIAILGLLSLFLLLPLAMIALAGLPALFTIPALVFPAAFRSLLVALAAVTISLSLALPMGWLIVQLRQKAVARGVELVGYLSIAASPMVLGTGLFLLLFPLTGIAHLALPVTAVVNAAISLPFVLRAILPVLHQSERNFGRLTQSLGISGWGYFRLVLWPQLRPAAGFAAGLTAALSVGDLGVITLFSSPGQETLPLVMYHLLAAYKTDAAGAVALVLVGLSLGLFWIFDQGGRVNADA